jgi:hypothetical protein
MSKEDLRSRLQAESLDQAELGLVIQQHFGHGKYAAPQEIHYARAHDDCAVRILYDDDGTLTKILAGPDLQVGDIEELQKKIEIELLQAGPVKVRRRILFTTVPTTGAFRYKDVFQILPVPAEAPRPHFLMGEHPLVLEIAYGTSSNFMVSNLRQEKAGRQLELVLSSLLQFGLRSLGPYSRFNWSLDRSGDTVILPSKFLQEGYTWEGAIGELDQFSPLDEHPMLVMIDVNQYYSRIGLSIGQVSDLPSDIEQQLDRFFALPADDKEKFLRASYWFQNARGPYTRSRSASFTALVSAIEALMPPPKRGKLCPECKQMIGPGSSKQFADFVEALVPGSAIPESERKRFYRLRSALSHGGKLLLEDQGIFWGFTPQQLGEGRDGRIMWQIVQTVLHNWLCER